MRSLYLYNSFLAKAQYLQVQIESHNKTDRNRTRVAWAFFHERFLYHLCASSQNCRLNKSQGISITVKSQKSVQNLYVSRKVKDLLIVLADPPKSKILLVSPKITCNHPQNWSIICVKFCQLFSKKNFHNRCFTGF